MHKVLVTGTTFIRESDIALLEELDISVERLDEVEATEEQLIDALSGKHGYFLGGLEKVTEKVLRSAKTLRAICFTGAAWDFFVPGHEYATEHGIAITSAQGANSQAVAEYAVSLMHDRVRHISYLSGDGRSDRIRGKSFRNLKIGIVGAGNVGGKVGRIVNSAYGSEISYTGPSRKLDFEYATGAKWRELSDLLDWADVICLHMPKSEETKGLISAKFLDRMTDKIIVSCTSGAAMDGRALLRAVAEGRVSVASDDDIAAGDGALLEQFRSIGTKSFIQSGSMTAYNADQTIEVASNIATEAMISILTTGNHSRVVNPKFIENTG